MPQPDESSTSRERRLEDVLADYLRFAETGLAVDREALILAHPDLADDLRSFFANRDAVERLAEPLRQAASPADTPTVGMSPVSDGSGSLRIRYFGDYELLEEIARGGMGVVYKARQTSLNRIVAVKMILSGQFASEADVRRFRQEAEAAAGLDHPHIVPIYEVGEHEGLHYFSMKLIDGTSLRTALPDVRRDPRAAIRLLATVARAVHHAHQRGVLHRDLKPGNILLDREGQPHVTDFGLAKRVEGDSELTQTGAIVGTPNYMAPEQATGRRQLTTGVDVYSLGAILYELLTGQPPFQADSVMDTILKVRTEEPEPPRRRDPRTDRDLETVCLKCLEKDPDHRYDSAAAVADDLDRWLAGEPVTARPVGSLGKCWRWSRRNPGMASLASALLLLLVASAIGATVAAVRIDAARDAAVEAQRLEASQRAKAEASDRESSRRLSRHHVAQGIVRMNAGDSFDALPWLVEGLRTDPSEPQREDVHRIRIGTLLNRSPRLLAMRTFDEYRDVRWMEFRDGRLLAAVDKKGLLEFWDVQAGRTIGAPLQHPQPVSDASLSPDGDRLLSVSGRYGRADSSVRVWELKSGSLVSSLKTTEQDQVSEATTARFSPDGKRILTYRSWNVMEDSTTAEIRVWDAETGEPLTPFRPQPVLDKAAAGRGFEFDATGRRVVSPAPEGGVWVWNAENGEPLTPALEQEHPGIYSAAFSQDGGLLAIGCGSLSHRGGAARVWNLATGKPVGPPIHHSWVVFRVEFTPDGKRLATVSGDGIRRVWDVASGKEVIPSPQEGPLFANWQRGMAFGPDGLLAAAIDARTATFKIWNLGTGAPVTPRFCHESKATYPVFDSGGLRFATSTTTGIGDVVRIWELNAGTGPVPRPEYESLQHRKWSSPDAFRVLALTTDGMLEAWDAGSRSPLGPPRSVRGDVVAATFAADGCRAVVRVRSPANRRQQPFDLVDVMTGEVHSFTPESPETERATDAFFSPDGRRLVTVRPLPPGTIGPLDAATLQFWDAATGRPEQWALSHPVVYHGPVDLTTPEGRSAAVTFSDDGRTMAAAAPDGRVYIRELASGRDVVSIQAFHPRKVEHTAFRLRLSLSGGRLFVAGTAAEGFQLGGWDAQSGEVLWKPISISDSRELTVSQDGKLLAATRDNSTIGVWDLNSGQLLGEPWKETEWATSVAWDPQGRRVAIAGLFRNMVRLWDTSDRPSGALPLLVDSPYEVAFSPDGRFVVVEGLGDSPNRVFDAATGELVATEFHGQWSELLRDGRSLEDLRAWSEVLAGVRMDDTGGLAPVGPAELQSTWDSLCSRGAAPAAPASPDRVRDWQRKAAMSCTKAGESGGALLHFNRLIAQDPADWALYFARARVWSDLKDWERAAAEYGLAVDRAPERPATWMGRGDALAERGQWGPAARDFAKAAEIAPTLLTPVVRQAMVALSAGDATAYQSACNRLIDAFDDPADLPVVLHITTLAPAGVEAARLIEVAERMTAAKAPAGPDCLGFALYRAGDYRRAVAVLNDAAKTPGYNADRTDEGGFQLFLAMARRQVGDMPGAAAALKAADDWYASQRHQINWEDQQAFEVRRREAKELFDAPER